MTYNEILDEKQKQSKILVVDDNIANVLLLKKMLELNGYTNIKTTTDSREVMALYNDFKPELVLLDLKMPFFDGFDILEQLNSIKGDDYIPVIVVTAQGDKLNKLRALELGAKDFITKPYDYDEVTMRIKNMLEVRVLHLKEISNNQKLAQKVQDQKQENEDVKHELVKRLLKVNESKDDYTKAHLNNIGYYCYRLGFDAGYPIEDCKSLYYASMLHDIGKVSIPDSILLKDGPLTTEEKEQMKLHTIKGSEILEGSTLEVLKLAEKIALGHHEKWDGTGYPLGLKGDSIPVEARITSIVDVFDALIGERAYKKSWTLEAAVAELKQCSGTNFDPVLVALFLENLLKYNEEKADFKFSWLE